MTPLEGLVMGTRCGDIDPAIVFHLARVRRMPFERIERLMNVESGLLGLSGVRNDVRELLRLDGERHENARLALDVFCYRLKKYIGAYCAVLGRVDALIFTAGIGENAPAIRARACFGLGNLGIVIDPVGNKRATGVEADISPPGVRTRVLVIPTDEEKLIAMDTYDLARRS